VDARQQGSFQHGCCAAFTSRFSLTGWSGGT
jgi:hypothetical protein